MKEVSSPTTAVAGAAVLVATLLLLATSTAVSAIPCNPSAAVTSAIADAESACQTSNLAALAAPTDFIQGSEAFCRTSCINAINVLVRSYPLDGSCNDDPTYLQHRAVQLEQRECNAPSTRCLDLYHEYLFFSQSAAGRTCLASMANARRDLTQAAYAVVCTSACATQIESMIAEMRSSGCATWTIFQEVSRDFELLCNKDDDGTTYCEPEYLRTKDDIFIAANSSVTTMDRNTALENVCTSCFNKVQQIEGRYKEILGLENQEGSLCMRYATTYCTPIYDAIEASVSAVAVHDEQVNLRARLTCPTLATKKCVQRLWSYEYGQYYATSARKSVLNSFLLYSCLDHQTSNNLCASLVQTLIEGLYQESAPGYSCSPSDVQNGCANPPSCLTWDDPSSCSFGCSSAVDDIVTELGCCFNSMMNFHGSIAENSAETSDLFARMSFLSSSCCARQHSACDVLFAPQCSFQSVTEELSITITTPPYRWIIDHEEAFTDAFRADLAMNLGHPYSLISDLVYEEVSLGTTVTFSLKAASVADVTEIATVLSDVTSRRTFNQWSSLGYYQTENAGATAQAAFFLVAVSFLISQLVAFLGDEA